MKHKTKNIVLDVATGLIACVLALFLAFNYTGKVKIKDVDISSVTADGSTLSEVYSSDGKLYFSIKSGDSVKYYELKNRTEFTVADSFKPVNNDAAVGSFNTEGVAHTYVSSAENGNISVIVDEKDEYSITPDFDSFFMLGSEEGAEVPEYTVSSLSVVGIYDSTVFFIAEYSKDRNYRELFSVSLDGSGLKVVSYERIGLIDDSTYMDSDGMIRFCKIGELSYFFSFDASSKVLKELSSVEAKAASWAVVSDSILCVVQGVNGNDNRLLLIDIK